MIIDDALFDRLANLSKLQFSDEERSAIKCDLQKMLDFIDQINEIDTEGVEPLIHINKNINSFREDVAKSLITKQEALKNAPKANEDFFIVPKVIDKG